MISPFPSIMFYYNSMKTKTITHDQFIQGNYMNKLDFLSDVLEDFCSKHNIPFMSADDIITAHIYAEIPSLTLFQQKWLDNYIEVWDIIAEVE